MNYLKTLLSPRSRKAETQYVNTIVKLISFSKSEHTWYEIQSIFQQYLQKSKNPSLLIEQIFIKVNKLHNIHHSLCIFYLLHKTLSNGRNQQITSIFLQDKATLIKQILNQKLKYPTWILSFFEAYLTYMLKLPLLQKIIRNSIDKIQKNTGKLLACLSWLIRQISSFIAPFKVTFKSVGRYMLQFKQQFNVLFQSIQLELIQMYFSMKKILQILFRQIPQLSYPVLQDLLQVITDVEVLSDSLEEIIQNKYFSKILIDQKIIIKHQTIMQIQYQKNKRQKIIT